MDKRVNPRLAKTIGDSDKGSRGKAEAARERSSSESDADSPMFNEQGIALVRVKMAVSELIPTGNYANVSIGPVEIMAWVDPDEPVIFSQDQKENIVSAMNQLAEMVEVDVVAVQRNLVLEALQGDGKKND